MLITISLYLEIRTEKSNQNGNKLFRGSHTSRDHEQWQCLWEKTEFVKREIDILHFITNWLFLPATLKQSRKKGKYKFLYSEEWSITALNFTRVFHIMGVVFTFFII
jgi:hypothetical protein